MRNVQTISDRTGSISLQRSPNLFDSGYDLPLIQAFKKIRYGAFAGLPSRDTRNVDLLLKAGALTRCHVLDVRPDDPENFRFEFYGADARIGAGGFRHHRVGDHQSLLLRRYACLEYSRIKGLGQPDLTQVHIDTAWSSTTFRRLILPFGERGEVTHFLIFFVPDIDQIGTGSLDQEVPAVRQRIHN